MGDNLSPDRERRAEVKENVVYIVPNPAAEVDLTGPLRAGLIALPSRELEFPKIEQATAMLHVRPDTLAQLADPKLTPERRAELRMELCTKSGQFRAATAQWQRLLQGEWPGFEGAAVPKDQAPAEISALSPIRRLYLLALIDAAKYPQIHGHAAFCTTAAQIAPVLTREMMATPTISLAMMSLMQTLETDKNPDMTAPRAALMKRLDEVATKEWLKVLEESIPKFQVLALIDALDLKALLDALDNNQILENPALCETVEQIAPLLTKELLASEAISTKIAMLLAISSEDKSPEMAVLRAVLMKRLKEVATKEWLAELMKSTTEE